LTCCCSLAVCVFLLFLFFRGRGDRHSFPTRRSSDLAQHLNNALTECLKWGGVNLLCHGRARASFSLTLRAGAMLRLLDRIGPPGGRKSTRRHPRHVPIPYALLRVQNEPGGQGRSGGL